MEEVDGEFLGEDDDALVSRAAAERVREHAAAGCLMCELDDWDDE